MSAQGEMFDRPQPLKREDLLNRAKALYTEIITLKEDLAELQAEFTYDKEDNKLGLSKSLVKSTMKIAEVYVANSFEKLLEKRYAQEEFEEDFKELTGYDD